MNSLLIAGAGGHGCVVADAVEMMGRWQHIAFLDDRFPELSEVARWPVVGPLSDANGLQGEYKDIVVAIGDNDVRVEWLERYGKEGFSSPVVVHPRAYVSSHAALSDGTVVFAQAAVNFGARIGLGCIVNTGAVIEHDCSIGEGTHICPGVRLAGGVLIGRYSWIGIGAVVREGVTIGKGRGPTRLISPFSTFQSSGNSSRLVLRRKRPSDVSRSASVSKFLASSLGLIIVRNLYIPKGLPFSPGLLCLKKTGWPRSLLTFHISKIKRGERRIKPTKDTTISSSLFIIFSNLLQHINKSVSKDLAVKLFNSQLPCTLTHFCQNIPIISYMY